MTFKRKDLTPAFPIELIKHESVDLVLTDILMPEMEGNALAAKLSTLCPGLPIIGMTGGGRTGDPERVKTVCLPKMFCTILSKPFLEEELYSAINRHIKIG
ncbi:response regulator [Endozoicomonas sp.]|uniref:response regulator n=1 Tax=Endozoicomonas sp. TaxID=1892382 RepID=UPI002884F2CC|nr:response regulator [Endozoicomonas sp.]